MPYKDPAMARARRRHRDYMRLATESDITPEQELAMRKRARKCPLCGVYMTSKPNRPNSKHLDHILPLNQLGTHTHGNVRIICAACNMRRPKDGSDYMGTLTLWAEDSAAVARSDGKTCRNGLHPWVLGSRRCAACAAAAEERRRRQPLQQCKCGAMFAAAGRTFMCKDCIDAAARRAAELHASGDLSWDQVAAEVGYSTAEGARYAAKRIGYTPAARPRAEPQRLCPDCGAPKQKGARNCDACLTEKAWRAVELYNSGTALRPIAEAFGFRSVTTVSNLIKSVAPETEMRVGRPGW